MHGAMVHGQGQTQAGKQFWAGLASSVLKHKHHFLLIYYVVDKTMRLR